MIKKIALLLALTFGVIVQAQEAAKEREIDIQKAEYAAC